MGPYIRGSPLKIRLYFSDIPEYNPEDPEYPEISDRSKQRQSPKFGARLIPRDSVNPGYFFKSLASDSRAIPKMRRLAASLCDVGSFDRFEDRFYIAYLRARNY